METRVTTDEDFDENNSDNQTGASMQAGRTQVARAALSQREKQDVAALFQSGRLAEIVERANSLTARYPTDAYGWSVLSAALLHQGRNDQALVPLRRALDLSPGDAGLHGNLGLAFLHLGRLDEAMVSLQRALAINPAATSSRNTLANALAAAGRLEEAADAYQASLAVSPDQSRTLYNLGNTLLALGRPEEAVVRYRAALALTPDYPFALVNYGVALAALERPAEAEDCARRALRLDPALGEAQILLTNTLLLRGYTGAALAVVEASLDLGERPEMRRLFVACLRGLPLPPGGSVRRGRILTALAEPWGRSAEVAAAVAPMLEADTVIGGCVQRTLAAWPKRLDAATLYGPTGFAAVTGDALLLALLDASPIAAPGLERFFTLARSCLLEAALGVTTAAPDADGTERETAYYAALARQCRINEYVFDLTADEADKAARLTARLSQALAQDQPVPAVWVLAVAAFGPLHAVPQAQRLLKRAWPEPVALVLTQQLLRHAEEQRLRGRIVQLTPIDDVVSRLVRRQYEENPYPRWVRPAPVGEPAPLAAQLRERFPRAHLAGLPDSPRLDVLIAGCGTGQHSLETARVFHGANVLAVDLSLTSLCYARRKTRELGVANIEYAQADLLRLGELGRSFDLVESSGVLHHLADPAAGWRSLVPLVRPGGVMRIGLYSRLARRGITKVRDMIAARGLDGSAAAIRSFRQELLDMPWEPSWGRYLLGDFFSVSGCRDLLFHVQEHCLSLLEIKAFCLENGLAVLGVEVDPPVLAAYRTRFPNDAAATNLSNWHAFEEDNPDTFIAMYQFWVQKTG
ncbi:tetratricopeptide repeat protein [Solidesulfovibrio aerotolerans]|nr:tetratricopeptide repeat protein [Solidesulfovibrio aerotolerans]